MNTIDKAEEKRLIGSIERAISSTNRGEAPNDAIAKVAREEQFSPQFIHRMVESFNKSKAVHRLKEASEGDRHKDFSLADADKVIEDVFSAPMHKAASGGASDDFIPSFTFGIDKMMAGNMQKAASVEAAPKQLTPEQVKHEARVRATLVYKQAHVVKAVKDKLHREVVSEKYAFDQAIDKACEFILPMNNSEFRKVAQIIHNGYPQTGNTLVQVFSQKTRKPVGDLQKTANAVVFPAREPYITIGKIYEHAEKLASAEQECALFEKESLNFLTSAAANALGNVAITGERSLGESLQGTVKKKTLDSDEILDPEFYNRLRELDARRSLMKLVLHDEDLRNYKYSDVVKAYNSSVSSVPEAADKPSALKTLILSNLESSGQKDVVQLAQEQQLAQSMAKTDKDRESIRQSQMAEDEAAPEQPQAVSVYSTAESLGNNLKKSDLSLEERAGALTEGTGKLYKSYQDREKEDKLEADKDKDKWLQEANTIVRGGNPKNPMNLSILGQWQTGRTGHTVQPAKSIAEIATDLKEIHTVEPGKWRPATRVRAREQYNMAI